MEQSDRGFAADRTGVRAVPPLTRQQRRRVERMARRHLHLPPRAPLPRLGVAMEDQLDAAARAVARNVKPILDDPRFQTGTVDGAIDLAERALDDWQAHGNRYCVHIRSTRPEPIVYVWWLHALVCHMCTDTAFGAMKGTDEDFTCDRCRVVDREGVHPVLSTWGPMVIAIGLCSPCRGQIA